MSTPSDAISGLQPLPLQGLRVLDATHIVAGPYCAMILADMGAEVIKIERPGVGDRARLNDPWVDGPDGGQVSARYLGVNRNKKSVALDLRDPVAKRALHQPGGSLGCAAGQLGARRNGAVGVRLRPAG